MFCCVLHQSSGVCYSDNAIESLVDTCTAISENKDFQFFQSLLE